jgi:Cys/Met metabolism PLP-dependent enzyme
LGEVGPSSEGLTPLINLSTNYEQLQDGSYHQDRLYTRTDNPTYETAKWATSFGSVESLIEERRSMEGPSSPVPHDVLRLSVEIEDPQDLVADLEKALDAASRDGASAAPTLLVEHPDERAVDRTLYEIERNRPSSNTNLVTNGWIASRSRSMRSVIRRWPGRV